MSKMDIKFNVVNDNEALVSNEADKLFIRVTRHTSATPNTPIYSFKFYYGINPITFNPTKSFETINVWFKNGTLNYVKGVKNFRPITVINPIRNSDDNFYTSVDTLTNDELHARHMVMGFFNTRAFKLSDWHTSAKRAYLLNKKRNIKNEYKQRLNDINNQIDNL